MRRTASTCLAFVGCSSEPELIEAPRCLGLNECDGQCVNLQTSRLQSGECGNACAEGEACSRPGGRRSPARQHHRAGAGWFGRRRPPEGPRGDASPKEARGPDLDRVEARPGRVARRGASG